MFAFRQEFVVSEYAAFMGIDIAAVNASVVVKVDSS